MIKVEGVQRPDAMRFTSAKSPTEEGWWEWSAFYQANNFNKRDLTLDLTLPRGRDLLLELVGVSDVLIENFAPRVLDAYGINWETVHATNPHAVMVRMPAFGLDGPWRNRVGFAQTMEQISGLAWVTGYTDGPPIIPGGPCDPVAGMHAAFALLCALEERDRSGIGQFVEVAMVEAALNIAAETVIELSAYGATLSRNANRGAGCRSPRHLRVSGDRAMAGISRRQQRTVATAGRNTGPSRMGTGNRAGDSGRPSRRA